MSVKTHDPPTRGEAPRSDADDAILKDLSQESVWSDAAFAAAGLPIVDRPLVTVGGGLGSFAVVDFLRNAGVRSDAIAVLGPLEQPYAQFRHLCRCSQIRDADALRSDSGARIDNIWGWPGYAVEEAFRRRSVRPLWTVAVEPVLRAPYTPPTWLVLEGLEREMARIGWAKMLDTGRVVLLRRRAGGGYFAVFMRQGQGDREQAVVYRSRHLHLALGYPGVRLLPDVRRYRDAFGDRHRVVAAYEHHDHVYSALRMSPGTVLVRGAGITAARIVERLLEERERFGTATQIVHLFRTYVPAPTGPRFWRRDGGDGFSYQHFTFPKAAGGGQIRQLTRGAEDGSRHELIAALGGTTTPRRGDWVRLLARARDAGCYRTCSGTVVGFFPSDGNRVETCWETPAGETASVIADFVIDATGLVEDASEHDVVAGLVAHTDAAVNRFGGLAVEPSFEVRGTRSGTGRLYASGSMTRGAHLAPVDSFAGLSHAALEICDDLAHTGFSPRITATRSLRSWWRWARNKQVAVE